MMTGLVLTTYTLITSVFSPTPVFAVVIHEVFPNPEGDEKIGEWVELYNNTDTSISLTGFLLKDTTQRAWVIPDTTLDQGHYLVVWRENQSMSLNNDQDSIQLYESSESATARDSMQYQKTVEGRSWSRVGQDWMLTDPTPGYVNSAPSPTPTPSPSPSPIPKPKPSNSPTTHKQELPAQPVSSTKPSSRPVAYVSQPILGEVAGAREEADLITVVSPPSSHSSLPAPLLKIDTPSPDPFSETSSEPPSSSTSSALWWYLAGGSFLSVGIGKIIRLWQLHHID